MPQIVRRQSHTQATGAPITQVAHGFNLYEQVYSDGTNWLLAQADDPATLKQGMVTEILGPDVFVVTTYGTIAAPAHGYTLGATYWLSTTTAGAVQGNAPTGGGDYVQKAFEVLTADSLKVVDAGASLVAGTDVAEEEFIGTRPQMTQGRVWAPIRMWVDPATTVGDTDSCLTVDFRLRGTCRSTGGFGDRYRIAGTLQSDEDGHFSLQIHEQNRTAGLTFGQFLLWRDGNVVNMGVQLADDLNRTFLEDTGTVISVLGYTNATGTLTPVVNAAPTAGDPLSLDFGNNESLTTVLATDVQVYMPITGDAIEGNELLNGSCGSRSAADQNNAGWIRIECKEGQVYFLNEIYTEGVPVLPQTVASAEATGSGSSNVWGAVVRTSRSPNTVSNRWANFYANTSHETALASYWQGGANGDAVDLTPFPSVQRAATENFQIATNQAGTWTQNGANYVRVTGATGAGWTTLVAGPRFTQNQEVRYRVRTSNDPAAGNGGMIVAGSGAVDVNEFWFLYRPQGTDDIALAARRGGVLEPPEVQQPFAWPANGTEQQFWVTRRFIRGTTFNPTYANWYRELEITVYADQAHTNMVFQHVVQPFQVETEGWMAYGFAHQTTGPGDQAGLFEAGELTTYHLRPRDMTIYEADTWAPGALPAPWVGPSVPTCVVDADGTIEQTVTTAFDDGKICIDDTAQFKHINCQVSVDFNIPDDAVNYLAGVYVSNTDAAGTNNSVYCFYSQGANTVTLRRGTTTVFSHTLPYVISPSPDLWNRISLVLLDYQDPGRENDSVDWDARDKRMKALVFFNGNLLDEWEMGGTNVMRPAFCLGIHCPTAGVRYRNFFSARVNEVVQVPNTVDTGSGATGDEGRQELPRGGGTDGAWYLIPESFIGRTAAWYIDGYNSGNLSLHTYASAAQPLAWAFCGAVPRQPNSTTVGYRGTTYRGLSSPAWICGTTNISATQNGWSSQSASGDWAIAIPGNSNEPANHIDHSIIIRMQSAVNSRAFFGGSIINHTAAYSSSTPSRARIAESGDGGGVTRLLAGGLAIFQYADPTDAEYQVIEASMNNYLTFGQI